MFRREGVSSYAAVLGHYNRERLCRKGDRALKRHSSPKACMVKEGAATAGYNSVTISSAEV